MAGKIDKSHTHFLRAVDGNEWELWSFSESKRAHFVRRLSTPAEVPGETVVALPAERTVTFPAWLATNDRTVIPAILHLQLEKRGLLSKNSGDSAVDYRVIDTRGSQTLAVATILQPEFPAELTFERVSRFEPSAYTFPLPQDRLVIWREKGRLTVAATRGREPVAVQVLSDDELSETAALELKCIALQLQGQQLCDRFLGITLWGEFSVLGLVGYIYWQRFVADHLRRHIQDNAPTVAAIQGTAERWRQVEWAVNPKLYPVEILYQIAGLLPHDGLRLTALEIQKGTVVVRGEASTAPAAFKFAEDIKAKPELQMFTWQMASPTLRPDGRAEFNIEGVPKFAKIN
jgi:hypothetical protein